MAGHRDAVYALAGRPGSDQVFSGSADGMVVGWDAADPGRDGELLARVENSVYALRDLPARGLLLLGHNFQGVQAH
ncbi:MAG: WD40 repeat domain-containing protein [Hymenobacter sp.]